MLRENDQYEFEYPIGLGIFGLPIGDVIDWGRGIFNGGGVACEKDEMVLGCSCPGPYTPQMVYHALLTGPASVKRELTTFFSRQDIDGGYWRPYVGDDVKLANIASSYANGGMKCQQGGWGGPFVSDILDRLIAEASPFPSQTDPFGSGPFNPPPPRSTPAGISDVWDWLEEEVKELLARGYENLSPDFQDRVDSALREAAIDRAREEAAQKAGGILPILLLFGVGVAVARGMKK